jgi:hypothetical protein
LTTHGTEKTDEEGAAGFFETIHQTPVCGLETIESDYLSPFYKRPQEASEIGVLIR